MDNSMVLNQEILACPYCRKSLFIKSDYFECLAHGKVGWVKNDMIYLHKDDSSWDKCENEKNGWINLNKKIGIYMDNDDHFYIPDGKPHLKTFYRTAKLHLDKFFEMYDIKNKVVLDLGAGFSWVSNLMAQKGARVISLECNDDPLVGLGRAVEFKKRFNTKFDCIVGDMENIPLVDKSVDYVLMVDALHHFDDMKKVLSEVYRVLKKGGIFAAINEPYRPDNFKTEKDYLEPFNLEEIKFGIRERRPTIDEYLENGKDLDLKLLNSQLHIRDEDGLFLMGKKG